VHWNSAVQVHPEPAMLHGCPRQFGLAQLQQSDSQLPNEQTPSTQGSPSVLREHPAQVQSWVFVDVQLPLAQV
jgi:hypothetical protein